MKNISLLILALLVVLTGACTKKTDLNEQVLNLTVTARVKGMDPIYASDLYSGNEVARVYEGLLEYHYLKRPYTLQPNLAEALPTVSKDGLTYTFKIKKGIKFADSEAFPGGKGKELTAQDFVYSMKRMADPKLQSTGWWLIDGKIVGLNEWRKANETAKAVDYKAKVEGLVALDKYTLQFKLVKPFPQFLYALAMPFTYAVAKEVVEKYGKEFLNYPVGTGPFMLKGGKFNANANKFVYIKNPNFRNKYYPSEGAEGDKTKGLLSDAGKKLPLVDTLVVNVMEQDQTRWLNFQKGKLDYISIPKDNFETAVTPDNGLTDDLSKKGIVLEITPGLDVTYIAFNHEDPLFKENVALRRAMSLAYDAEESNKLFYSSRAFPAQSIVPPGIAGNVPSYKNPYGSFNIEKAKALLKEAGFEGGKGLPEIVYETTATTTSRQMADFFKKKMSVIGINIKVSTNTWPQLLKKVNTKQAQMFGMAWGADYPDAENFLQLLYGANSAPGSNGSNYKNSEFDRLFKIASVMQDTPERTALYEKLNRIAAELVPWIYGVHRMSFVIKNGWLKNFKYTEFSHGQAQYLTSDLKAKAELIKKM